METALKVIPAKAKFADEAQREDVLKIYREGIATLRQRLSDYAGQSPAHSQVHTNLRSQELELRTSERFVVEN